MFHDIITWYDDKITLWALNSQQRKKRINISTAKQKIIIECCFKCRQMKEVPGLVNARVGQKSCHIREYLDTLIFAVSKNVSRYILYLWKIRANDKCDVCGSSQTIDHLLYNCNYVRPLWRLVERKVGIIISFEQILGLDPLFEYDSITTIISILIYKEWLLSLENKQRNADLNIMYYKSELQLRTEIYKLCKRIDQNHVDNLMELI